VRAPFIVVARALTKTRGTPRFHSDIEGAEVIAQNTAKGLIALISELRTQGRKRISPHFQISFDNAMLGDFPGLQHAYDVHGLAEVVDFFVPMAYDQNGLGQLARSLGGKGWGGNAITAAANSPLPQIEIGLSEYNAGLRIGLAA
jgi:hypothetical protein